MISKKGLNYYLKKIDKMVADAYKQHSTLEDSELSPKQVYEAMYWRKIPKIANSIRLLGSSYKKVMEKRFNDLQCSECGEWFPMDDIKCDPSDGCECHKDYPEEKE